MPSHPGHPGNRSAESLTGTSDAAGDTAVQPTIAELVDAIFTRFDSDGNALITAAELSAVLDPEGTHADLAADIASLITKSDSNSDLGLGAAELTTALDTPDSDQDGRIDRGAHGPAAALADADKVLNDLLHDQAPGEAHVEPAPVAIADLIDGVFTRFDSDANASITLVELLGVFDADGKHVDLATLLTSLVAQIDTDADSALSLAEITAAVNSLDSDQSGTLERSELHDGAAQDTTPELIGILLHAHDSPEPGC